MEPCEFPVALNLATPRLDREILLWAWKNRLFVNPEELEKARIQKLNWFASYLFPEAEEEVLRGTMKFFLWLFLIDDLMESENKISAQLFLDQLKDARPGISCGRFDIFLSVLPEIQVWGRRLGDKKWQTEWKENWLNYLEGMRWEFHNKNGGIRPRISDYQRYRPYFSGVFLAIHLLRLPEMRETCKSALLEQKMARLICLANDISSFEKEKQAGDFHNEILLLISEQEVSLEHAKRYVSGEVKNLIRDIKCLSGIPASISDSCSDWTSRLNLLLGGCLYWSSQDTDRYSSSVNGHSFKL